MAACAVLAGCAFPTLTITDAPPPVVVTVTEAPPPVVAHETPEQPAAASIPRGTYTDAELAYFSDIALGAEYGDNGSYVRKWTRDVHIAIHGSPTSADRAALNTVIADLNALIDTIDIDVVTSGQNVDLYFLPEPEFSSVEPEYVPENWGYFTTWWDTPGDINYARVLIDTKYTSQTERSHLLREEVTQMLGLMNDTYEYPTSMFYQDWTTTQTFASIDKALIRMLYEPELTPGMDGAAALAALRGD